MPVWLVIRPTRLPASGEVGGFQHVEPGEHFVIGRGHAAHAGGFQRFVEPGARGLATPTAAATMVATFARSGFRCWPPRDARSWSAG